MEYDERGKIGNRYIHGQGIDEPLAMINKKETYYYHADGLGSIVALTDKTGKTVQTYEYDSFGNLKDQKNKIKQPYAFTAREWDRETKLYYYRARYYDAKTGRFTQKDPIGFGGGDANLYPYVGNNPINFTDPWGLDSLGYWGGRLWHLNNFGLPINSWPATSGPYGNGALPPGNYTLPSPPVPVPPNHPQQSSFCDPSGNCWWQPITPSNFCTDRSGLGIHPDGNVPGTAGCIGVQCQDTNDLYDLLRNNPGLPLTVK